MQNAKWGKDGKIIGHEKAQKSQYSEFCHNHFVVGKYFWRLPRVAQKQQPWALLRNLFEIG
jgi:hypothetical protein